MAYPTWDQFVASYFRQYFSLPDSIIYYIMKNPHSSVAYQKLIQSCKYFFIKNPILVFHCLKIDDDGWKICSNDCYFQEFAKRINITLKTLSGCKIWIQDRLHIFSTNSSYASDLIPSIYQCDAEKLQFHDQKLTLQQFLLYSNNVTRMILERVVIKSNAYSIMPIEEIVAVLPHIENFTFEFGAGSKNVSKVTVKKLLQIPHFKQVTNLRLLNVSEEFDIDTFYKYYKNTSNGFNFTIKYQNLPSEEYAKKLNSYVNKILEVGIVDRHTSLIFYPGQDNAKKNALMDLCERSWQYFD